MTKAFNVEISDINLLPAGLAYREIKLLEFLQNTTYTKIQNGTKVLDGRKLEESWFKPVQVDFFISHKSEDSDKARKLGAYLQSKGKSVFIDSSIWGNIKNLQKLIDEAYCKNTNENTYDYDKRNQSTSYTHMLLANALLKTIRSCESFVFLNTRNSIRATDIVTNTEETNSPWIYFEINVANSLLAEVSVENFSMRECVEDSMIEMAFEADLKRFDKVNIRGLLGILGIELPLIPKDKFKKMFLMKYFVH